jgi:hypothetical protein
MRGLFVLFLFLAAMLGGCAGAPKQDRWIELVGELPTQSGRFDQRGLRLQIAIPASEHDRSSFRLSGDVQSVGQGYMGLVSILVDVDGKTESLYARVDDLGTWALPSGRLVRSESFHAFAERYLVRWIADGAATRVRAVGEWGSTGWFAVPDHRKQELIAALDLAAHVDGRSP